MSDRPSGTVTFLFTDIQGSTRLWEQSPEAMATALARHDALLRSAIEFQGGYVFKTVGDAFCAAFATAPRALAAALAGQRALLAEPWPTATGPLLVRMALHTGAAEERGGDYFGPPLNRVARLLSAGHGGQILLSLATQELTRDVLADVQAAGSTGERVGVGAALGLADLGEHRLKDLNRPERVFQLVAPDLPAEFPPLRTLDTHPNNLPAQRTPLIDRERELEAAQRLLLHEDARLLTLTGAGGTGKTRLGLQVAADLIDHFEHGVYFVPLAQISDPDLVVPTVARTLGVPESGKPLLESLKDFLHNRQLLLVLDNFEQVLAAYGQLGDQTGAAYVLTYLGQLSHFQSEVDGARGFLIQSEAAFRELGDRWGLAYVLFFLGNTDLLTGDYAAARARCEESLALFRQTGDRWGIALPLAVLGRLALLDGDHASARAQLEESIALRRQTGDRWGQAHLLNGLGDVARHEGDYERARALDQESLGLFREADSQNGIASVLHNLGYVALAQGDSQRAAGLFGQSLKLFDELEDKRGVAECLVGLAGARAVRGEARDAARLFGVAEAQLEALGASLSASNQAEYARHLALARAALDDAAFAAAWAEGRGLAREGGWELGVGSWESDRQPDSRRLTPDPHGR